MANGVPIRVSRETREGLKALMGKRDTYGDVIDSLLEQHKGAIQGVPVVEVDKYAYCAIAKCMTRLSVEDARRLENKCPNPDHGALAFSLGD